MASSGEYYYSAEIIGNQTLNVPGVNITLTRGGSVPSSDYTITDVYIERTFRAARYVPFQVRVNSTIITQELDAQTGGKAYSSRISSSYYSTIKTLLTGLSVVVNAYGVGGSSGELASGSTFKITISWRASGSTDSATSFTCASSVNLGEKLTITGTAASSSYTHTLTIKLLNSPTVSGDITQDSTTAADGIKGEVTPPAFFANQIPKATRGTATVTLTTKKGSTTIGSKSRTVTVVVPDTEAFRPSLSDVSVSELNQAEIDGTTYTLQNHSSAKLSATGKAKRGATIKKITFEGQDINKSASGSTDELEASRWTSVFTKAGSFSFTITVTDSRDLSTTVTTDPITVTAYTPPAYSNLTISRCTSSGDISHTGTYGVLRGSASYTRLGSNNLSMTVETREGDGAYSQLYSGAFSGGWLLQNNQGTLYELAASSYYYARLTFTDQVVTLDPIEIKIPAAYILMRWEPQNSAFGYGCYPTGKKRVEIADDWGLYHKGVDILSVLSTHEWLSCPVLWESTTAWSSGTLTDVENDLSKWQVIEAIISSGATGILTKDDSNIFRGVCFGGTSGGFFAYMPLIAVNSATSLHMNRFEQVAVSHSGTPTVDSITTQYGVVKLIGIKHV